MQLTGSIDGLSAGEWEIQAFVREVGYVFAPEPITVNVTLSVEGLQPGQGGSLGGTLLTIRGHGLARQFLDSVR